MEARLAEFKGGRSPVNVVLQSQQRRADAQISYYRALGEYNKSINYVDYLKGTMLANSNITLAEGPWNKKAYWDALERARERSAGKKTAVRCYLVRVSCERVRCWTPTRQHRSSVAEHRAMATLCLPTA